MLKIAFLADLKERLYGMPQEEIEERLSFYNEMINDRMEEGLSEEDAVAAIGSVDEIATQIMSTIPGEPLPEPVPMPDYAVFQPLDYPVEDVKPEKSLNGLKTAFLLLGFPIWGSLLIAAFAVVFALIVSLVAVVISFWAVAISLAASTIACIPCAVGSFIIGRVPLGIAWIGCGMVCAGLAILLFLCGGAVTRGLITVIRKMAGGFFKLFRRKERRS